VAGGQKDKESANLNRDADIGSLDIFSGKEEADLQLQLLIRNLSEGEAATMASMERIAAVRSSITNEALQNQLSAIDSSDKKEEVKLKERKQAYRKFYADTLEIAQSMEQNLFKFSTSQTKVQMADEKVQTAKQGIEKAKQAKVEAASTKMNGNHRNKLLREAAKLEYNSGQAAIQAEKRKRDLIKGSAVANRKAFDEKMDAINESFEAERQQHNENIENLDIEIERLRQKEEEAKQNDPNNPDAGKTFRAEREEYEAKREQEVAARKQNTKDQLKEGTMANVMKGMTHALNEGLSALGDKLAGAVDDAINTVGQYRSGIDARLQGMLEDNASAYDKVAGVMKDALAVSPFVKQTELLSKLNDAVDKGIAYNVEQRAFLATITDKIVSTFDAFDSNLMRLIRLQQADTTQARMGMEARLLQFFNSTFSDNTYLKDSYDTVSGAIVDAGAQMSREMAVSFEFNVQKWLGSLYSLGFDSSTIETIATGIGHLGTGNVQALAGDTQLQSLLAMASSRAGLSYSELLVKGIDDSSVNLLLKSIVEYLREIATDNNAVVKAAYGDVFKFTQGDLRAASNLLDSDITNIFNQSLDYKEAVGELNNQLGQLSKRLSTSEMIENVFDNFLYTAGESIANNTGTAITWKVLSAIEGATGGIHLPAISVFGNMLDLSTFTIEGIMKTGIFGLSALGNVGKIASSIASGGGLDLSIWDATEYTRRGGEFNPTVGGVQSSVSGSKSRTSGASSDTKKESLNSTKEDQEMVKQQSEDLSEGAKNVDDLYKALFEERKVPILVQDALLYSVLKKDKDIGTGNIPILEALPLVSGNGSDAGWVMATADAGVRRRLDDIYTVLSNWKTSPSQVGSNGSSNTTGTQKVTIVNGSGTNGEINWDKLLKSLGNNTDYRPIEGEQEEPPINQILTLLQGVRTPSGNAINVNQPSYITNYLDKIVDNTRP